MSYPNITDRISYLEQRHTQDMTNIDTNKADKTDLNNYLPLSGGTMTGRIDFRNAGYLYRSFTSENENLASEIGLAAVSNINDPFTGAALYLHDIDDGRGEMSKGSFHLCARNNNHVELSGHSNGALYWNGQDIPTSYWVGGNNCTALVYSNGWVEQWGYYPQYLSASSTVTTYSQSFAYPFISDYYCLIVQPTFMGGDWGAEKYQVCGKTSTYFTLALYNWRNVSQAWYCWYACGTWK